jgi:hypothetical protein
MIYPPQKLSYAEKIARDEKSGKNNIEETIDYYISQCTWANQTTEIANLYAAVEGIIHPNEYKYVQNPFNIEGKGGEIPTYGAKLRNYNILKGIANLLMGEFGRRSHEFVVFDFNPDAEYSYKEGLAVLVRGYYAQHIANELAQLGMKVGQQVQELPPLEEYVAGFKEKYTTTRVISGQDAIDYIRWNCDLDNKYIDLYWDWVVTGRAFTYKAVNHDDVMWEAVPAHELFVPNEKHSRFIEDYSFAVRRNIVPVFKVVDFFRGRVGEELMEALEQGINKGFEMNFVDVQATGRNGIITLPANYASANYTDAFGLTNSSGIEVFHVQYRTWRKFGVLTYIDEIGQEREMEVDETYKLNKAQGDINIIWDYESQIMQGYRALGFYLDCGPLEVNRADLNSNGEQKLSYNGIIERSFTGELQSIIKQGLPYQVLVNVLHYQTEKLINKNKDKLLIMPYGLINKKAGMNTKSTMYHADATSILWVDETAPNASFAAQMIKSVDMGLGNYISNTVEVMKFIKSEYWEEIGMNAQRYSDVGQNAGKAVTEQAIVRSAIITAELTRQFDKLIEKDYAGLLDYSKVAWINGKKKRYIRTDGSLAFLNINADEAASRSESSFGIFVKDAALNTEAVTAIRGQALNLIQNNAPYQSLSGLYSTNNVAKLDKVLEKMEKLKNDQAMLMQKQAEDAQQALQDSIAANDAQNREIEYYKIDSEYAKAVDSASIRSEANSRNEERPSNEVERRLADHKIQKENKDLELKDKKLNIDKNNKKAKTN